MYHDCYSAILIPPQKTRALFRPGQLDPSPEPDRSVQSQKSLRTSWSGARFKSLDRCPEPIGCHPAPGPVGFAAHPATCPADFTVPAATSPADFTVPPASSPADRALYPATCPVDLESLRPQVQVFSRSMSEDFGDFLGSKTSKFSGLHPRGPLQISGRPEHTARWEKIISAVFYM